VANGHTTPLTDLAALSVSVPAAIGSVFGSRIDTDNTINTMTIFTECFPFFFMTLFLSLFSD
jgi:hypothetical protein